MKNRSSIFSVILATTLIALLGIGSNLPSGSTSASISLVLNEEKKNQKASQVVAITNKEALEQAQEGRVPVKKAVAFNDPLWKGNK